MMRKLIVITINDFRNKNQVWELKRKTTKIISTMKSWITNSQIQQRLFAEQNEDNRKKVIYQAIWSSRRNVEHVVGTYSILPYNFAYVYYICSLFAVCGSSTMCNASLQCWFCPCTFCLFTIISLFWFFLFLTQLVSFLLDTFVSLSSFRKALASKNKGW